ncbi:unnamed protein product (macronuclear) [Paramecium tetraurelia]|uniref:Uncharacterized protein n=1 Tax=Paramecium tetraurelia TaxID=5888 RepID=A0D5A8_PARTE|nr:uncharacterized protein GSPATT00013673001 [Paramecium tetraurelia]CAK78225.1 unnamed protein product [Paramecium tetraurelia]|eukprot:XP_001445622.1 hypothetical protein (macronuclear) [Paramecium tetraurelia strain d4-2]
MKSNSVSQYKIPSSLSPPNFSKQLIFQQKQLFLSKVRKQMQSVNDPFNSNQISKALRNLETQQQRKKLLDSIIKLRESKKMEDERLKHLQLQKLWEKANHTNSKKLNTDFFYHRDFEDFESIKQQRYRFESERIENFYIRNEGGNQHNLPRISSLNCLTTAFVDQRKVVQQTSRRTRKNLTAFQNKPRDLGRNTPVINEI